MSQQLFRNEALESYRDRLNGEINLTVPTSWHAVGIALLSMLAVAIFFLTTATYSRVETVAGAIVLDRGVAHVVPPRPGVVEEVGAMDGQRVSEGDSLIRVRSEVGSDVGETGSDNMIAALERQTQNLEMQRGFQAAAASAERARLEAQISGLVTDMASFDSQIASQSRLVEILDGELREAQAIASRGFISRRDIEQRERSLIRERMELARLEQARSGKRSELIQANNAMAQASAVAQAEALGLDSSREQLGERITELEMSRGYTITSPISGIATAVTARVGQSVSNEETLMMIIPSEASTLAELYVPSSSAGLLDVGQEVRLSIDSFPSQTFGTVNGRIVRIASAPVRRQLGEAGATPVYLVTVAIAEPSIEAFGRTQSLIPGMSLSARIVTQEQTLLQWLFQPLHAVLNR